MLQNNEIINFLLGLILFSVFYIVLIKSQIVFRRRFLLAFIALFSGTFFTIIESYIFHALFNYLEHISYTITAFLFYRAIKELKTSVLE